MKGELEKQQLPKLFGMQVELAAKELADKTENYLLETLNAKKGEITSKEDLKKYSFTCPICNKEKNASEAILLTDRLDIEQKLKIVMITEKVLLVCRSCINKMVRALANTNLTDKTSS